MGWENRKGGRYFYTKQREGSRVMSTYLGQSEAARLIDEVSSRRRACTRAFYAEKAAEIEEIIAEDEAADEIFAAVDNLMREALTAAGFHQHKRGEWRRARNDKSKSGNKGTNNTNNA